MRGRIVVAAAVCAVLAVVSAGAGAPLFAGPIVFASDRSYSLDVVHRWRSVVADGGTSELPLPEGTPSPNGRATAVVSSDAAGSVVDVRAVPSGATHRVATFTASPQRFPAVSAVVWSPNGRWLAIVVDIGCRVEGASQCNLYDLWAVRADGTRPHEVSLHARSPSWSSDSRELTFAGNVRLEPYVSYARVRGGAPRPLGPGVLPVWVPHHRAIVYQGAQGVQLVVPGRRGVRPLVRRLRLLEPVAWSRDGRRMAFVAARFSTPPGAPAGLYVADAAGRRLRALVSIAERRSPSLARWSPDGRSVAYVAGTPNQPDPVRNVFATSANGRQTRQVTNLDPWFSFRSLAWTGNGKALIYQAAQTRNDLELFSMTADGSAVWELTHNTREDSAPSWSPDGQSIVYQSNNALDSSPPGLFRLDLATGVETRLTSSDDHDPAWSPDGAKIAFSRWDNESGGPQRLYLTDPTGTTTTPLTPADASTVADYPSWAPDGKRLVYSDEGPQAERELFVINRDGTGSRQLTTLAFATAPAWSPDGTKIAFAGEDVLNGHIGICVINSDGSGFRRVVNDTGIARPAWSPDSTRLLYAALRDAVHAEIHLVKLDGSDDHVLTTNLGSAGFPAWTGTH